MLFTNQQWAVTSWGLSSRDPSPLKEIPAERLTELAPGTEYYLWPLFMAEKSWVDLSAFIEAFSEALRYHACEVNLDRLLESFKRANKDRAG